MLKPDLIRACKERRLPFIGTRAQMISALIRESAAEKAVPGEERKEKCNAEREARGCLDEELPKRDQNKILASQDHEAGSGSILEEEKLLQKNERGRRPADYEEKEEEVKQK